MNVLDRRNAIKQLLSQNNVMQVRMLSQATGVSEVSVRRDLKFLEREGVLNRVHGGAILVEEQDGGRPFAQKVKLHAEEKRAIGCKAAAMVQPGEHLILDSGSTVLEVARHLRPDLTRVDGRITVITESLPIVQALGHRRGFDVIITSGLYYPQYETFLGPQAIQFLTDVNVDKFIVAADGVTIERGITADHPLEAELMQAMAAAAAEVILVADSSKIGCRGFVTALPMNRVHRFVTDPGIPDVFAKQLEEIGVQLVIADTR